MQLMETNNSQSQEKENPLCRSGLKPTPPRYLRPSLMPSLRAAALFSSVTARIIAFNLKAASNACRHLSSMVRVFGDCSIKHRINDLSIFHTVE